MPGRSGAGLLAARALAIAIAMVAAACNEGLCTRTSECDVGFVCTPEALCEPAPDASPSADASPTADGGGPADASGADASGADASLADADLADADTGDPFDLDAGVDLAAPPQEPSQADDSPCRLADCTR